jgi:hypothetical protein
MIVLDNEIKISDLPSMLRNKVVEILINKKKSNEEKKSMLKEAYEVIFTYDLKLRLNECSSATHLIGAV